LVYIFPFEIGCKKNEYVQSLKIPSIADHKASGLASAAGTIAGLAATFTLGVSFKYTKGTDGFITFKDCLLITAKIIDYTMMIILKCMYSFHIMKIVKQKKYL